MWLHGEKGTESRLPLVTKDYNEAINDSVNDMDDMFASHLAHCPYICPHNAMDCMSRRDISTAFLHAAFCGLAVYMWPPAGFYTDPSIL